MNRKGLEAEQRRKRGDKRRELRFMRELNEIIKEIMITVLQKADFIAATCARALAPILHQNIKLYVVVKDKQGKTNPDFFYALAGYYNPLIFRFYNSEMVDGTRGEPESEKLQFTKEIFEDEWGVESPFVVFRFDTPFVVLATDGSKSDKTPYGKSIVNERHREFVLRNIEHFTEALSYQFGLVVLFEKVLDPASYGINSAIICGQLHDKYERGTAVVETMVLMSARKNLIIKWLQTKEHAESVIKLVTAYLLIALSHGAQSAGCQVTRGFLVAKEFVGVTREHWTAKCSVKQP
ncbi:hypothetical protein B7463_g3834, partial [Scytalidium lignicola]